MTCSVADCKAPHHARGFCISHYNKHRYDGEITKNIRPWTADEEQQLQNLYGKMSRRKVAERLGRTSRSVGAKLFNLAITKEDYLDWSAQDVAGIFGVSRQAVQTWLAKKYLKGRKVSVSMWRVSDEAVWKFIHGKARTLQIDPALMPESAYRDALKPLCRNGLHDRIPENLYHRTDGTSQCRLCMRLSHQMTTRR